MGKLIEFKFKNGKRKDADKFLHQLAVMQDLYISGQIDKILIIAEGDAGKCCTSNELNLKTAKIVCNDFVDNWREYIDSK